MTPEEWTQGMKNEAASVEDSQWARDTRAATWVFRRRPVVSDLLLVLLGVLAVSSVFWVTWISAVNCRFQLVGGSSLACALGGPNSIDIASAVSLALAGLLLGGLRVRLVSAVAVFALTPLVIWMMAPLIQAAGLQPKAILEGGRYLNLSDDNPISFAFLPQQILLSVLFMLAGSTLGGLLKKRGRK